MAQNALSVKGLRDMNRALARAGKEARAESREIMRDIARPAASHVEQLAVTNIRNIGRRWPLTRIGMTQKSIYIVPKERGRLSKADPRRRRPNLRRLLASRAYDPARSTYAPKFKQEFEHAFDRIADRFNHS